MHLRSFHGLLRLTIAFLLFFVASAQCVVAQTPLPDAVGSCPVIVDATVTDAYRVVGNEKVREVKLRDTLTIEVAGLDTLRRALGCELEENRKRSIVLFLDDRPLVGLEEYPPTNPEANALRFILRRDETSREVWTELLGKPWPPLSTRPTKISVGFADGYALDSDAVINLKILPTGWLLFWVGILLVMIGIFWKMTISSGLLRGGGPSPAGNSDRPFSLSQVQAAWWFFLVLTAYLFIGLVTGDYSTSITPTALILLGISASTTIASTLVDARRADPDTERQKKAALLDLDIEVSTLETEITNAKDTLELADSRVPETASLLAKKSRELSMKESQLNKLLNKSEGFWRDILSDINGVSFHRFQMVGWTLVLGIVFIIEVYRSLAMPRFSDALLGLMGISSAAYVGLKGTEAKVPAGKAQ